MSLNADRCSGDIRFDRAVPVIQTPVDNRAIVDKHLPDLDQEWRSTVERLVAVILGALAHAEHDRKWGQLTFTSVGTGITGSARFHPARRQ